jgi:hypothetical protein
MPSTFLFFDNAASTLGPLHFDFLIIDRPRLNSETQRPVCWQEMLFTGMDFGLKQNGRGAHRRSDRS